MTTFTDKYLQALPRTDKQYFVTESNSPGFSVRVSPKALTFYFIQRQQGKRCLYKLGNYPSMSLLEARRAYLERYLSKDITKAQTPPISLVLAYKRYEKEYASVFLAPSTVKDYSDRAHIVIERLGNPDVLSITRKQLKELFKEEALVNGQPVNANRMKAVISSFFKWFIESECDDLEELPINPCLGLPKYPEKSKTRYLTNSELEVMLPAIAKSECWQLTKAFLLMSLLTGTRSGELRFMSVDQIDFQNQLWTIPAENTKNGHANLVPLVDSAMQILLEARKVRSKSDLVFTQQDVPLKPISGHMPLQALQRLCASHGIPACSVHDLRRTVATHLGPLCKQPHIISSLLNHSAQGITRQVYNLYSYIDEKREALQMLEKHYLSLGLIQMEGRIEG